MTSHQKSLFNPADRAEINARLSALEVQAKPQWGEMNAGEMATHCHYPLEVAIGEKTLKRGLMGMLFGKMIKRQLLQNKPLPKNSPTVAAWRTAGSGKDFEAGRKRLSQLIEQFGSENPDTLAARPHPVFGPMTAEEWGVLNYKHLDHHLRQFGV